MIKFDYDNYAKNLPDCYRQDEDSNNYKILAVERHPLGKLRADLQDAYTALDLQNAVGDTLNHYGQMVGQARGVATDEQYVLMILSKIMRNLSTGDYISVAKSICSTFDCEPSEVLIVEKDEPATVELVVLPLGVINKVGLTTRQTVEFVKRLLPAGVKLESFLFEGTFEFAHAENEYDETKGFSDVENGTIGGYLGIAYGEDDKPLLPLD